MRFSAINPDLGKTSPTTGSRNRDSTATRFRPRIRPHIHDSQIQTEGHEFVNIQAPKQLKKFITTSTTPETITAFESMDTDQEYGFIRPPNFRPAQTGVTSKAGPNQVKFFFSSDHSKNLCFNVKIKKRPNSDNKIS